MFWDCSRVFGTAQSLFVLGGHSGCEWVANTDRGESQGLGNGVRLGNSVNALANFGAARQWSVTSLAGMSSVMEGSARTPRSRAFLHVLQHHWILPSQSPAFVFVLSGAE